MRVISFGEWPVFLDTTHHEKTAAHAWIGCLAMLLPFSASATTYYLDTDGGDDPLNSGTSEVAAVVAFEEPAGLS